MSVKSTYVRSVYGNSLAAAVDAGVLIVPPSPKLTYTVVDAWVRSAGTAITCTSVDVTDLTTSACVFGVAALTDAALVRIGAANTTATNLGTASAKGAGLYVKTAGAAIGTATAIEYHVRYLVTSDA